MLTYSVAPNATRRANLDGSASDFKRPGRDDTSLGRRNGCFEKHARSSHGPSRRDGEVCEIGRPALEITPARVVSRRGARWDGVRLEIIQQLTHDKIELRFRAPCHLLLVYEDGVRADGETVIGDRSRSTLRVLKHKLTFVPAGYEYREWHQPHIRSRIICLYLASTGIGLCPDASQSAAPLVPHLFFEDNSLWDAAVKLATTIEEASGADRYAEALGVIVAHELLTNPHNARRRRPRARGGLAAWQRRVVDTYIEEHLAEPMPLAELAKLVSLSPFHFCRAFKQSFGAPPHRFHINRRIERAKSLLADPAQSITDTAISVGFSEPSSFSTAFRNAMGFTPTEYRRGLR